jgi:hypothetical protein
VASLQRIQEITDHLMIDCRKTYEETLPKWIRGYDNQREMHLSGELREATFREDVPDDILALLDEAAETLDDAHEEWLERQI